MSIQSLKNRINKRVELYKYKNDYTDIGSFIKRKRKELNVTQDEISNGICSISYLSKIENNQIVPNDFYINEIMEKLDVDKAVYSKSLKEKEYLNKVIKSYFFMDDNLMEATYEEIKNIEHNLVINLCKLGYIVYFKLDDDNQYVMMLEHLVNNMSDFELKLYLFFAAIYFMENEKYKTALELILLNEKLPKSDDYLSALFSELSYYVKQRLMIKNCSNEDYFNAVNIYSRYHNVDRIMNLALNKTYNIMKENPSKAHEILKTIKSSLLKGEMYEYYQILHAELLYQLEKYNDSTLALKEIDESSKYYLRKMTLLLRICIKAQDLQMIDEIKEIVRQYKPSKREMKSKVYYHYLIQDNEKDMKEYLRDIAIPFSIQIEDYYTLQVYIDSVMEICISNSRYKEAMQYYKKFQKEILKLQKIMY